MVRTLAIALAVAIGAAGIQTYRLASEQADHAATRAGHAEQLAGLERAAREAEQNARAEEQRRAAALQGAIREAETNLARARADAAAAASAGERMRQRVATLTSSCRAGAGHPASSGAGPAAGATGDLLADVFDRVDQAVRDIAEHADAARAAGLACQAGYDALTP